MRKCALFSWYSVLSLSPIYFLICIHTESAESWSKCTTEFILELLRIFGCKLSVLRSTTLETIVKAGVRRDGRRAKFVNLELVHVNLF